MVQKILTREPDELVRVRDSQFPFSLWDYSFGPYPWFVTPYLGRLLHTQNLNPSQAFHDFRSPALKSVPSFWKKRFLWGQWDAISQVQFRNATTQHLIRLDKALLSTLICIAATKQVTNSDDQFDSYEAILPSIFVVDDLEKLVSNSDTARDIAARVGQHPAFIKEAGQGLPMLEHIAHAISGIGRERYGVHLPIRMLKGRKDDMRGVSVRPIQNQIVSDKSFVENASFYGFGLQLSAAEQRLQKR